MMGGMGRTFGGGYAEYTCVPVSQTVPFTSDLEWATLGAVPEILQTSYGSLTLGLDAQPGQSILIRRGHFLDWYGHGLARQANGHDGAVHHSQP